MPLIIQEKTGEMFSPAAPLYEGDCAISPVLPVVDEGEK